MQRIKELSLLKLTIETDNIFKAWIEGVIPMLDECQLESINTLNN